MTDNTRSNISQIYNPTFVTTINGTYRRNSFNLFNIFNERE